MFAHLVSSFIVIVMDEGDIVEVISLEGVLAVILVSDLHVLVPDYLILLSSLQPTLFIVLAEIDATGRSHQWEAPPSFHIDRTCGNSSMSKNAK